MRWSALAGFLLVPVVASAQTTVYGTNTFEGGFAGLGWSGAGTVQSTGGLSAFGFGAQHLRNDTQSASILTLSGLAPHTSMTLSFLLAMWDSIDNGDQFQISADGNLLFNSGPSVAFGNYGTLSGQCEGPGTRVSGLFTSFGLPDYGYNTVNHDCGRSVSFTFAHSASSVVFSFQYPGSQTLLDESFGLDNVLVQTNTTSTPSTVPEPSTYGMLGLGLVGLLLAKRRRV
jgi:hypothetical protein